MRYPRIDLGFCLIGAALVLAALASAWVRSGTAGATPSAVSGAATQPAPTDPGRLGAEVYASRCSSCHRQGERRGRSIPPLQGFAVELLLAEGGREYLVDFLLDGRVRQVTDDEVSFEPSHPKYDGLSDGEAAAVLNHMLTSWGNAELLPEGTVPYTQDEIALGRQRVAD